MDKIYCWNTDTCSYEEVKKPFMMYNLLLLALMFTSAVFFLLTCYYHAQNEKTLDLVPGMARNCFSEVESLKAELNNKQKQLQLVVNQQYQIRGLQIKNMVEAAGASKTKIVPAVPVPLKKNEKVAPKK
jgi:hypothetical protein